MSNKTKLFEKELARRNPDWDKFVAVHNAAIKDLEEQLAAERDAKEKEIEWGQAMLNDLTEQLATEREKNQILEEELKEAVKLLKLEDIDAAIAKIKVTKSIKK